jgi:hypothetical protein
MSFCFSFPLSSFCFALAAGAQAFAQVHRDPEKIAGSEKVAREGLLPNLCSS